MICVLCRLSAARDAATTRDVNVAEAAFTAVRHL